MSLTLILNEIYNVIKLDKNLIAYKSWASHHRKQSLSDSVSHILPPKTQVLPIWSKLKKSWNITQHDHRSKTFKRDTLYHHRSCYEKNDKLFVIFKGKGRSNLWGILEQHALDDLLSQRPSFYRRWKWKNRIKFK